MGQWRRGSVKGPTMATLCFLQTALRSSMLTICHFGRHNVNLFSTQTLRTLVLTAVYFRQVIQIKPYKYPLKVFILLVRET